MPRRLSNFYFLYPYLFPSFLFVLFFRSIKSSFYLSLPFLLIIFSPFSLSFFLLHTWPSLFVSFPLILSVPTFILISLHYILFFPSPFISFLRPCFSVSYATNCLPLTVLRITIDCVVICNSNLPRMLFPLSKDFHLRSSEASK